MNPLSRITAVHMYVVAPAVFDWDGDGDADLIVGAADGTVRYFERVASTMFELRNGGDDPFSTLPEIRNSVPLAVDWDGDGDVDLAVPSGCHGSTWSGGCRNSSIS